MFHHHSLAPTLSPPGCPPSCSGRGVRSNTCWDRCGWAPLPACACSKRQPLGQPSESSPQVPGRGVDTAQPPCSCPICWGVGDMSPRGRRHVEGCGWGSKGGPHPRVVLTRPSGCWGREVAPGRSNVQGRLFGRTLPIEWKTGCKASVKVHSCGDASWKDGTRGTI